MLKITIEIKEKENKSLGVIFKSKEDKNVVTNEKALGNILFHKINNFLEETTGKNYEIIGNEIVEKIEGNEEKWQMI